MTQKERIDILLAEYVTLRQELLQRSRHPFIVLTLVAVLMGFVMDGRQASPKVLAVLLLAGLFIAAVGYRLTRIVSQNIEVLESRINEIAGEEMMSWEIQSARLLPNRIADRIAGCLKNQRVQRGKITNISEQSEIS